MRRATILLCLGAVGCFSEPPDVGGGSTGDVVAPSIPADTAVAGTLSTSTSSGDGVTTAHTTDSGDESSGSTTTSSTTIGNEGAESDESSLSSSTGTGGEPAPDPYGDCYHGPIADGIKLCLQSCMISIPDHSACAPDCGDGCDLGPEGTPAACLSDVADGVVAPVCFLPCNGEGAPCPAEMECASLSYTQDGNAMWACMWP